MPVSCCTRCLEVDISADAHPERLLRGDEVVDVVVCPERSRATELEFRTAAETRGVAYVRLPIRDGLRRPDFS
ncbi:MAG TPA: hypothetical protein VJQ09_06865 [Candidatus Limnocylindria bacterium]|nr:hypothetical protein [Candidatus Limnocylindria bacterium]